MNGKTIVAGLGEIGRPLLSLISKHFDAIGVDIEPVDVNFKCDILHICYPFEIADFVGTSVDYIEKYQPVLTIINSTVAPGTTRYIYELAGKPLVHSPVRGKHHKMGADLLHYIKFIGGIDEASALRASEHFQMLGLKTKILANPEATELAKLTETTYFGLLITWAQELERYCRQLGLSYDEVVSFYDEIGFFPPVKYFPGHIDGHCVMPNVKTLRSIFKSGVLEVIERSNEMKAENMGLEGWLELSEPVEFTV